MTGINRLRDGVVRLFGDQPAAGAQCCCHAPQDFRGIAEVHEKQAAVHEVVGGGLDVIAREVAPAHLDVRLTQIAEEPRINLPATTCPFAPTRSESQRTTEPPPAPTSRQRHPVSTPIASRYRKVC